MSVANTLIYNGELRCGSPAVAEASLQLPHQLPATQLPDWLQQVGVVSSPEIQIKADIPICSACVDGFAKAMCRKRLPTVSKLMCLAGRNHGYERFQESMVLSGAFQTAIYLTT